MGYLLVLLFYPEALLARPLRAFLRVHKRYCAQCPAISAGYCVRYRDLWFRVIQARQMLHRAHWAACKIKR